MTFRLSDALRALPFAVFLLVNALTSGLGLWDATGRTGLVALLLPVAACLAALFPAVLGHVLACFGASLVFFGFQSYAAQSLALVCAASWLGLACMAANLLRGSAAKSGPLRLCFLGFVGALAAGAVYLPLEEFAQAARTLGLTGFERLMAYSVAKSSFYALAGLNRLLVFALLAWELSKMDREGAFRPLFEGIAAGLVAAVAFGLSEYFLARGRAFALNDRLSSLFLNPGWFAEYVCVAFPFLFALGRKRPWGLAAFFAVMALCLAAMVLTMARAAWIVFAALAVWSVTLSLSGFDLYALGQRRMLKGALWGAGAVLAAVLTLYGALAVSKVSLLNFPLATMITDRLVRFSESPRPQVFKSGVLVGLESPVGGLGFETYARHYPRLMATPDSSLARRMDPSAEVFEATHNLFIQLFAGGGLVALGFWVAMMFWAVRAELADHRLRAASESLAVVVGLTAFHAFGLFQEMTYVPAVWLWVFVVLAHAMSLEDRRGGFVSPARCRLAGAGVALAVLAALGANVLHQGKAMAWPASLQDAQGVSGPEMMEGRPAVWSFGASSFVLLGPGPWEFTVGCPHPDMGERPVVAEILAGGKVADRMEFNASSGRVGRLAVSASQASPGQRVYLRVSRLYCPMVSGVKDARCLGVWLSGPGLP